VEEAGATGQTRLEDEHGRTRIRRVEETMIGSGGMTRRWQRLELDHPLDAHVGYISHFETTHSNRLDGFVVMIHRIAWCVSTKQR
jgi:hypothetical protein